MPLRPTAAQFTQIQEMLRLLLEQLAKDSAAQFGKTQARASRAVEDTWEKLASRSDELKEYLQSEDFESDLDELAGKLGIHYSEHPRQRDSLKSEIRSLRMRAKLALVFMTSGQQILGARLALPFLLSRPKLAKRLGGAMAVVKSAEILMQSWKVFTKKRRPKIIEVK